MIGPGDYDDDDDDMGESNSSNFLEDVGNKIGEIVVGTFINIIMDFGDSDDDE